MEIVGYPSKVKVVNLPWEEMYLLPIGDIQYGNKGFYEKQLLEDLEFGKSHDALYIGQGDYLDIARPTIRKILKAADDDTTDEAMEEIGETWRKRLQRLLVGTEGRWVGCLSGHHLLEYQDGTNSDSRLAEHLKAPYLGTGSAFVVLRFKRGKNTTTYTIYTTHGQGGGMKASAPLNKIENIMACFNADLYLMGHHHKSVVGKIPEISPEPRRDGTGGFGLSHRDRPIVATGSYLRGYMAGNSTYVEERGLKPVSLGCPYIRITPRRSEKGTHWIQTRVEV